MHDTWHSVCVMGSGAWGTALALLLVRNGRHVTLWSHRPETARLLAETGCSPRLPGVLLPSAIAHTADPTCVRGQALVVLATPSFAVRQTCQSIAPYLSPDAILLSASKGIEPGTGLRISEIIAQECARPVAVLSGPTHAEEVSRGIPSGSVVACASREIAEQMQDALMSTRFRVYSTSDVTGVELGGALKNVIALCAGVSDGIGYGDNTRALLMTRGLTELARLGMALGSRQETFAGLAGIGDLIVTCSSMHSRNRRAGILIGQGTPITQALQEAGGVVEGYYAVRSAMDLAKRTGVEMPITAQAFEVLYHGKSARDAMEELMLREKAMECEDAGWPANE